MPQSAGILVYRKLGTEIQFLLAHPGGPYYKNKSDGSWTIPKGLIEKNENPFDTAKREFEEETGLNLPDDGYEPLPQVRYKNGKNLLSWAIQLNDIDLTEFKSNEFELEWPPKSGNKQWFKEIDALGFFDLTEAKQKIHPVQLTLLTFIMEKQ